MRLPRFRPSTYDRFLIIFLLIIVVALSLRVRSVADLNQQLLPDARGINALTRMLERCERMLEIWGRPFVAQDLPCVFPDRASVSLDGPPDKYRLLLLVVFSDAFRALGEISFWNELAQLESHGVEIAAVVACREVHECRRFALSQSLRMPVFHDEKGAFLRSLNVSGPNQTPLRVLVNRKGSVLHVSSDVLNDSASQAEYLETIRRIVS